MPPVIDRQACTHCAKCVDACQSDVFFGSKEGEVPCVTYPEECWHCNACIFECPIEGTIRLRIPLPMMVLHRAL